MISSVRKKSKVPQEEVKPGSSNEEKEEDDMHDIMSQYLDNPQQNQSGNSNLLDTYKSKYSLTFKTEAQ